MPENASGKDDKGLDEFLRMVRDASQDTQALWEAASTSNEVPRTTLDKTMEIAQLARALARNELTLGKYLSSLRMRKNLSRAAVAQEVRLATDAIGELEGDNVPVQSIPADRMAVLAVLLDAFKSALVELLQMRLASAGPQALPRLTRMDSDATFLEAERARRQTQAGGPRLPIDQYLSDFSNAYDAEKERSRQP